MRVLRQGTLLAAVIGGFMLISLLIGLFIRSQQPALIQNSTDTNTSPVETAWTPSLLTQLYRIQQAAALEGWSFDRYRQVGDIWAELGDPAAAAVQWEAALALQPDSPGLIRSLAQYYLRAGRWSRAVELLRQLPVGDPLASTWLGLILARYDRDAALSRLETASALPEFAIDDAVITAVRDVLLEAAPEDTTLAMRVGLALADHQQWALAEAAFLHAAALAQPYGEAVAYLGFARAMQGKDGSADWIAHAIESEPTNAQVYYIQALYLDLIGDSDGAIAALQTAAQFDPRNPAYYAAIGQAYRARGNATEADYWLRLATIMDQGNNPQYQALLNDFYDEYGELLKEINEAERTDFQAQLTAVLTSPEIQSNMWFFSLMVRLMQTFW